MIKLIIFILFICLNSISDELSEDIYANSKNILYDKATSQIKLGKNSLVNYQGISIKTDDALINTETKKILINGKYYLNQGTDILKGVFLDADLELKEAFSKDINYIFNKDLKINALTLVKKGNFMTFNDSFITPCDLKGVFNCPTWSLKVKKTKYNIDEDFFQHFSTFINVADKKIAWLPYFSHYGSKAKRKAGFLTPTWQPINIVYGPNFRTPFYIPLNHNTDLLFSPRFYYGKFSYGSNLERYFKSSTKLRSKISEGNIELVVDTYYDNRSEEMKSTGANTSIKATLNLNKTNKLVLDAAYTSDISEYKNSTKVLAAGINSSLALESYNLINDDDVLETKFSGTKTLDKTVLNSSNPYEAPSLNYYNFQYLSNDISVYNKIDIDFITRAKSQDFLPNRLVRLNLINDLQKNIFFSNNLRMKNKILLSNKSKLVHEDSQSLNVINGQAFELDQYYSSELNKRYRINKYLTFKPRLKMIMSSGFSTKDLNIDSDSQSLSFNYNNLFTENRFFGSDRPERPKRIAIGAEQTFKEFKYFDKLQLNIGKSFDLDKETGYLSEIKQKSNFSDYMLQFSLNINSNNRLDYLNRIDHEEYSLKEHLINYFYENDKRKFSLSTVKTTENSFVGSDNASFLDLSYKENITNNTEFTYTNTINLDSASRPYTQAFGVNFKDDCSKLSILYTMEEYDDGSRLTPNTTLTLKYEMNYLGMFGYDSVGGYLFEPTQY